MSDEVKCPQCGEMVSQSVTQCDCGAYVPRTPVLHVDCYCVSLETVMEWEQRLVDALNECNRLRAENEWLREENEKMNKRIIELTCFVRSQPCDCMAVYSKCERCKLLGRE